MNCTNLNSITILVKIPPIIGSNSFDAKTTIHVVAGCKALFDASPFWKDFTIIEDAATRINEVSVFKTIFKDIIFSTSGQRTSKVIKGVNIINGKKVFVK